MKEMATVLYIGNRYITTLEELREVFTRQIHSSSISEDKRNLLQREIKTLFQDDIIQNWLLEGGDAEKQIAGRIRAIDRDADESEILKLLEEAITDKEVKVVRRLEDYLKLVSKTVSINGQAPVPFEAEISQSTEREVRLDITFKFKCVKSETERFQFHLLKDDVCINGEDINVGEFTVGKDYDLTFRGVGIPVKTKFSNFKLMVDSQVVVCEMKFLGDENLKFCVPGSNGTPDVEFKMIKVKGGTFNMASDYEVTLSDYYIAEVPVTQELWKAVMRGNSRGVKDDPSVFKGARNPVENVSWDDICHSGGFLDRLNDILKDKLPAGMYFALPTEAQWEFAARGGTKSGSCEYSGNNNIDEVAWYSANCARKGQFSPEYGTHEVATKRANEIGLFDMSGNVWEICNESYVPYPSGKFKDPIHIGMASFDVCRGGSWDSNADACAVSFRRVCGADYLWDRGFRLALSEL